MYGNIEIVEGYSSLTYSCRKQFNLLEEYSPLSAQAFVRPVGKGCKLELATLDILRRSCLQTKYEPLRLRNEDMASKIVSPAFEDCSPFMTFGDRCPMT